MKVSLFSTCLVDMFYPNVGKATVELLERFGCEVDFPEGQVCCGQPAFNSGYTEDAKKAMKNMIKAFEHAEYVVTPSGSCAYMFKEYPHVFEDEPEWKEKAVQLKEKTYELTQFLVHVLKIEDAGAYLEGTATYHTSCHMTRLLGAKSEPITLLSNVEGLQYVELPHKENCCGFGGTFSVKMGDISGQMVDEKVGCIVSTNADYLVGSDMACLMNIGGRLDRQGKKVKVMHIAEVLNQVPKTKRNEGR
ncbi:(Fe-S)-binding protein [Fictibacillus sp. Mic-4]|uniref:(Fe-S)-binding protein n=1 Tax=Fictibacillus sp. Mic-4 TaxID=3132826 RepID=UPI003CE98AA8